MRAPSFAGRIGQIMASFRPGIEASLDPVCIVDRENRIVYFNLSMKSLLGLKLNQLDRGIVFCDRIKLDACRKGCQVVEHIRSGQLFQLDEHPAVCGGNKMRLTIRAVPFRDPQAPRGSQPLGALMTVRDSTGEVLVQAKYHKLLGMVQARDATIAELEEKLEKMQQALRRARESRM